MGQSLSAIKTRVRSSRVCKGNRKPGDRKQEQQHLDGEKAQQPLVSTLRPIYTSLFKELQYESAPVPKDGAVEALLYVMLEKARKTGIPLTADEPISFKGFRLGFSVAVLAYPNHPVEVQAYIGLFTWIVVLIDDKALEMADDLTHFQARFFKGETQPPNNPTLQGMADILHEAYDHWDPVLANILVTSGLNFVTSNVLEHRDEFRNMRVTPQHGRMFPYYYRDLSGITEAYAIFGFPRARYPDVECFLEAIPDMALFINIFNDVTSFYKEEVAGETKTYVHNRARCEQKTPIKVVKEVKVEVVECVNRVNAILEGKGLYAQSWRDHLRGHISMHTTNPRYRLSELGLGEKHPLDGLWNPLDEALENWSDSSCRSSEGLK